MRMNNKYSSFARSCEAFFDILDSYAENKKSRAAVWPLQILLLILSPVSFNHVTI